MKIIKVDSCWKCPLREIDEDEYKCFATGGGRKIIYDIKIIQTWCPLKDYKEGDKGFYKKYR